jgi:hypothetical protein
MKEKIQDRRFSPFYSQFSKWNCFFLFFSEQFKYSVTSF